MLRGGAILVASDYSEAAAHAYDEARLLAEELDAPLEIIHVIEGWPGVRREGEADWADRMQIDRATVVTREGTPWMEILARAEEISARLVVVGSHGESGYQPLATGTTTARLLTHANRPVMVVTARRNTARRARDPGERQAGEPLTQVLTERKAKTREGGPT